MPTADYPLTDAMALWDYGYEAASLLASQVPREHLTLGHADNVVLDALESGVLAPLRPGECASSRSDCRELSEGAAAYLRGLWSLRVARTANAIAKRMEREECTCGCAPWGGYGHDDNRR